MTLLGVPFDSKQLRPAQLARQHPLRIGEMVLTLGHGLGGARSLTAGILSGLSRDLSGSELGSGLIQFDSPIDDGRSSGPLVDLESHVLGVTTAEIFSAEALRFAVPRHRVAATISDLKKMDHPFRPNIGMVGVGVEPALARTFGLRVEMDALMSTAASLVSAGS